MKRLFFMLPCFVFCIGSSSCVRTIDKDSRFPPPDSISGISKEDFLVNIIYTFHYYDEYIEDGEKDVNKRRIYPDSADSKIVKKEFYRGIIKEYVFDSYYYDEDQREHNFLVFQLIPTFFTNMALPYSGRFKTNDENEIECIEIFNSFYTIQPELGFKEAVSKTRDLFEEMCVNDIKTNKRHYKITKVCRKSKLEGLD